jgi:PAS domain S-box-containing protein
MKALLDRTQELSKVGGWEYEVATGQMAWADDVYRIYGLDRSYDPNDLQQNIAAYDRESAPIIDAAFQRALAEGEPYDLELGLIRVDGERIWVRTIGQPVIENGRVVRVGGNIVDITARKAGESERERLATIVECSQDAIIGKDRDGLITVWNLGAQRLYGYLASEAIGRPVSMLVPAARRGEDGDILGRVFGGERVEHYQTERICRDGSVVNVSLSVSPLHDSAGRVTGASSIARDVTSAVRAQEQIALQAQLLDQVDAAVTVTDGEGVVRYWSRGAQQLYGYDATEAVGRKLSDLMKLEEDSRELLSLRQVAPAGRSGDAEVDVVDKQGRAFPVYVRHRAVSLGAPDRASAGLISVSVDITARRNTELAIRRHASWQEEIADLGRLALKGGRLDQLFDCAVGAAWRILSSDCAWLVERSPDASDPVLAAEIGWPDQEKGEQIAGEGRSLSGYAIRSRESVVVEDWEQEQRFLPSSERLVRGVRSSVGVLVGDPDSPFGVLEVQYTDPHAIPGDCLPFLNALANILGEAIQSRKAQEMISRQSNSLAVMTESLRGLVSEKDRLIEQIPGVVMVSDVYTDGSGKCVFVSPQCETILGVAPSALLGDTALFLAYVHPEDRQLLRAPVRRPAASGPDPLPTEYRFVRPDGTEVWLRGVSAKVYAEDQFQRIQSVLFDMTAAKQAELERERLELDLRLAQKLEAVGQLAAGVAHEINTPVQFIGNSVTFLKRSADKLLALTNVYHELVHSDQPMDKEERRRRAVLAEEDADLEYLIERIPPAFERVLEGTERVSSIVRAMREFAHPSTERAPIDINEGIRTTLTVAKNEYKYVADIELDLGDLPLVMANASELKQVFLNLIVNASHAIEARVKDSDQRGNITVRTRADDARVLIAVSDTGCGIPADIAARVFDPFFTTKPVGRGTGQGLGIAHTIIVERHHGTINFEANPGGGTTFRVQLPRDAPATEGETLETAA